MKTGFFLIIAAFAGAAVGAGVLAHGHPTAAQTAYPATAPSTVNWQYAQLRVQGVQLWTVQPVLREILWLSPDGWYQAQNLGDLSRRLRGGGSDADMMAVVNRIGRAGWELVNFTDIPGDNASNGTQVWTFKRPVP